MRVRVQVESLGISRAVYYASRAISETHLELQLRIDSLHIEHAFAAATKLKKVVYSP